jgi:DNA-binding Xre family transcriptional regulator
VVKAMAVADKINALLKIRGVKKYELAEFLGMTPQSLRNKFNRGSFSSEDLIKISNFLDCSLVFEIDDKQKITLDMSDIKRG